MKKIKYLILVFAILLISGCGKSKEVEENKQISSTPLLIEVSKKDTNNKIYLMGSIHAADDTVYPLPDYIMDAYLQSDAIAFEFDLLEYNKDLNKQMALMSGFVYDDGKTINDYLEKSLYDKAVEILESSGAYSEYIDVYKPIMWETLIENAVLLDAEIYSIKGIDMHFLMKAHEDKKKIIELETPESQYDMLLSLDMELQKYLLEESIKNYDDSVKEMKELYSLYKEGNKEKLEKLLFTDEEDNALLKEYNDALITNRNKLMAQELETHFVSSENIFCVVGLAHIIGDEGIAKLFSEKGYDVNVIGN